MWPLTALSQIIRACFISQILVEHVTRTVSIKAACVTMSAHSTCTVSTKPAMLSGWHILTSIGCRLRISFGDRELYELGSAKSKLTKRLQPTSRSIRYWIHGYPADDARKASCALDWNLLMCEDDDKTTSVLYMKNIVVPVTMKRLAYLFGLHIKVICFILRISEDAYNMFTSVSASVAKAFMALYKYEYYYYYYYYLYIGKGCSVSLCNPAALPVVRLY